MGLIKKYRDLEVLLRLIPPLLKGWIIPSPPCIRLECCWLQLEENLTKQKRNILSHTRRSGAIEEALPIGKGSGSTSLWWLSQPCPYAGFNLRLVEDSHSSSMRSIQTVPSRGKRAPSAPLSCASFLGSPQMTSSRFIGQHLLTCKLLNASLIRRNVVILIDVE